MHDRILQGCFCKTARDVHIDSQGTTHCLCITSRTEHCRHYHGPTYDHVRITLPLLYLNSIPSTLFLPCRTDSHPCSSSAAQALVSLSSMRLLEEYVLLMHISLRMVEMLRSTNLQNLLGPTLNRENTFNAGLRPGSTQTYIIKYGHRLIHVDIGGQAVP